MKNPFLSFSENLSAAVPAAAVAFFALAGTLVPAGCVQSEKAYTNWHAAHGLAVPGENEGLIADFPDPYIRKLALYVTLVPDTQANRQKYHFRLTTKNRGTDFASLSVEEIHMKMTLFDVPVGGVDKESVAETAAQIREEMILAAGNYGSATCVAARKRAAEQRAVAEKAQRERELREQKRIAAEKARIAAEKARIERERAEAEARAHRELIAEVAGTDKKIYVASDDVFGWLFCSHMQKNGWKCVIVKNYADIPFAEEARAAQFLVKFSGRRSRDDFAETIAGTLVDLRTGASRGSVSRDKVSAADFAVALSEFFNPAPAESPAPEKSVPEEANPADTETVPADTEAAPAEAETVPADTDVDFEGPEPAVEDPAPAFENPESDFDDADPAFEEPETEFSEEETVPAQSDYIEK